MAWILIWLCVQLSCSSSVDLYVSSEGGDDDECGGAWENACSSVAHANLRGSIFNRRKIHIRIDVYSRQEGEIVVYGSLNIIGTNPDESYLRFSSLSPSIYDTFFTLNSTNANLIVTSASIIVPTDGVFVGCESNSWDGVQTSLTFISCVIIVSEWEDSNGRFVGISNPRAFGNISNCTFSASGINRNGQLFSCYDMVLLSVSDSFFSNFNLYVPTYYPYGGSCFYLSGGEISLTRNVFANCHSANMGGVLYVSYSSGFVNINILSCQFWNISGVSGGTLVIHGGESVSVNVTNSSFTSCTSSMSGVFYGANQSSLGKNTFSNCTFTECSCTGDVYYLHGGGALYLRGEGIVTLIDRCLFVKCTSATRGGAIAVWYGSRAIIKNTVFLGNWVTEDANKAIMPSHRGIDIYIHAEYEDDGSITIISDVQIENSFTDQTMSDPASIICSTTGNDAEHNVSEAVACPVALEPYEDASCSTFSADVADEKEVCPLPCVSKNGVCVKPDECPENYTALNGVCVPSCNFWVGGDIHIDDGDLCQPLCVTDSSIGPSLCVGCTNSDHYTIKGDYYEEVVPEEEDFPSYRKLFWGTSRRQCSLRPCEERIAHLGVSLPCGGDGNECFLDPRNGNTCNETCSGGTYYEGKEGLCVERVCGEVALEDCWGASWCVETETATVAVTEGVAGRIPTTATCSSSCANPQLYSVVTEIQPDEHEHRVCKEKSCASIGVGACRTVPWCVVTEEESVATCSEECNNTRLYNVSSVTDPYDMLYRKCVRKDCSLLSVLVEGEDLLSVCKAAEWCVETEEEVGFACSSTCANPGLYEVSAETNPEDSKYRKCVLKNCTSRVLSVSAAKNGSDCGSSDCLYDSSTKQCAEKDCTTVSIGLCRSTSWCVVTEEENTPQCSNTCTDDTHYKVSDHTDPFSVLYRKCVPKNCTSIVSSACKTAAWCVETEEEAGFTCSSTCTNPSLFEISNETNPIAITFRKCVPREKEENGENNPTPAAKGGNSMVTVAIVIAVVALVGLAVVTVVLVITLRKSRKLSKGDELGEEDVEAPLSKDRALWGRKKELQEEMDPSASIGTKSDADSVHEVEVES